MAIEVEKIYRIKRWVFWALHRPRYKIGRPTISQQPIEQGSEFTATFRFFIENRDKFQLGVNVDSVIVNVGQIIQRDRKRVEMTNKNGIGRINLEPGEKRTFDVTATQICIGESNIWYNSQDSRWGIKGIWVTLAGGYYKELYEGTNFEPMARIIS